MKHYNTPLAELICLNSADVITSSGDGLLDALFGKVDGANEGNTYTGEAPSGWGM